MSFTVLSMYLMQELEAKKKHGVLNTVKSILTENIKHYKELDKTIFFEEPILPKLECICRICENDGDISIFDNSRNRDITIDIKKCANVEIANNDGLPRHICAECLELLDVALLFKSKCEETDFHLRAKLTVINEKSSRVKDSKVQLKLEQTRITKNDLHVRGQAAKSEQRRNKLRTEENNLHAKNRYTKRQQTRIDKMHAHLLVRHAKMEKAKIEENIFLVRAKLAERKRAKNNKRDIYLQAKLAKLEEVKIKEKDSLNAETEKPRAEAPGQPTTKVLEQSRTQTLEHTRTVAQKQPRTEDLEHLRTETLKPPENEAMEQPTTVALEQLRIEALEPPITVTPEQPGTEAKEKRRIEALELEKNDDNLQNDHDYFGANISKLMEDDTLDVVFLPDKDCRLQKSNYLSESDKPDVNRKIKDGFVDCQNCKDCFFDQKAYKMHLPTCNFIDGYSLLEAPKATIPEKQPWLCEICGKSFRLRGTWFGHKVVHSNDLFYACNECPYRGRTLDVLRIHSRVHTGYRPYKCSLCPKRFVNTCNRRKHELVHSTIRPYKCVKCKKGFTTELILTNHDRLVHLGGGAYQCDICLTGLSARRDLIRHRSRVHNIKSSGRAIYLQLKEKEQKEKQDGANAKEITESQPT